MRVLFWERNENQRAKIPRFGNDEWEYYYYYYCFLKMTSSHKRLTAE